MKTPDRVTEAEQNTKDEAIETDVNEEKVDDDADDDYDAVAARKILIKKIVKFSAIFAVSCFSVYKLFIVNDHEQHAKVDSGELNIKPIDPAKEPINLHNNQTGSVVSKNDASQMVSAMAVQPKKDIKLQANVLEAPELPPLPDLAFKDKPVATINQLQPQEQTQEQSNLNANQSTQQSRVFNPQSVTQNGIPTVNSADLTTEQKRQMTMFVMSGSGPSINRDNKTSKSDFIIMDGSSLSVKTSSDNVHTQVVTNLETSLIQGKIVDATLETAINSQLPGIVRAVIANDVFGEIGTKILIPRGSRIFGSYSSTVNRGQSRLNISWTRIMRPDGVTVSINAQATDQFGRAGIEGDVDSRFGEMLANSLLVTFATLGAAVALDKISDNQGQTQTVNSNGTFSTTNVKASNIAAQSAVQQASNIANSMLSGLSTVSPIVTLPQGTKLKVMVAQDLTIPPFRRPMMP